MKIIGLFLKYFFPLLLGTSILFFTGALVAGFWGVIHAGIEYAHSGYEKHMDLTLHVIHAIEFFFIAPIPFLIFASYEQHILDLFPIGTPPIKPGITPEKAEKAFISSLVGIVSTFLLGKIIEILGETTKIEPLTFFLVLVFMIILVGILIIVKKPEKEG